MYQFYLFRRQDVLITKFTSHICPITRIYHTSDIDEGSLEEFGGSGGRATDCIRKPCQPEWINVFGAIGIKERRQRFIDGTIDLLAGTLEGSYNERICCTGLANAYQSIASCSAVIVYSRALVSARGK